MVKTKFAPRKTISIPKLELNTALLGARLSRYVADALNIPKFTRLFWIDSSITRNWLRAVAAYYTTFVSHRSDEILSLTEPRESRFVPGRLNIADVAMRWFLIYGEPIPHGWLEGTEFLKQPKELWPQYLPSMAVSAELRAGHVLHLITPSGQDWSKVVIDSTNLLSFPRWKVPSKN